MSRSAPSANLPANRRWRLILRIVLAGPLAFACAGLIMAGGALWLPSGVARIDNLVLPIVLFPAIWAIVFFYSVLDRRLPRAFAVVSALTLANTALLGMHWLERAAP